LKFNSVEERYQAIRQKVPPRRRFQIGLLLVTWKTEEIETLPKAVSGRLTFLARSFNH
jgi:hypothetical protein